MLPGRLPTLVAVLASTSACSTIEVLESQKTKGSLCMNEHEGLGGCGVWRTVRQNYIMRSLLKKQLSPQVAVLQGEAHQHSPPAEAAGPAPLHHRAANASQLSSRPNSLTRGPLGRPASWVPGNNEHVKTVIGNSIESASAV